MTEPEYDWRRELLLIHIIDGCPLCVVRFPTLCNLHRMQTYRLAIQRRDAAGAIS